MSNYPNLFSPPATGGHSSCPLCREEARLYYQSRERAYLQCTHCELIFVPEAYHLTPEDEKRRYDTHRNDPQDPRYRQFLNRLLAPLLPHLAPGSQGLDFGCGPGPALALMLEEQGFAMQLYDPCYAATPEVLEREYSFVTCSETVEHFRNPATDWQRLVKCVKPGGILAIMTLLWTEQQPFAEWFYIRDTTHLCFYTPATLALLQRQFGLQLLQHDSRIIILRRI